MKNVLLVFGGESYEHDISIVTASQIYDKTKLDDVKLFPLYISKDGKFFLYNSKEFCIKDFAKGDYNSKIFKEITFIHGEKHKLFVKTRFGLKEYLTAEDVIFACHGGAGENGELVSFFKYFGFGTSAGSVSALSVCMNKYLFKQTLKGMKLPTVYGFRITKYEFENMLSDEQKCKIKFLQFPVIIKSNNGGSSIGLFVAKTRNEFEEKLKMAFEFDDEILVEKYLENTREFNVAILGTSEKYIVSDIDEPLKVDEILTFSDKYLTGANGKGSKKLSGKNSMAFSKRKFPADIDESVSKKIKDIASKIFKYLGLSGVVRIDFLYQEKTNKLYVCEVNSIPGSLAYYFFPENKISTNDLVRNLISVSNINREKISCVKREYCTNILG